MLHARATPVFVDIDVRTSIDPEKVERAITPRTRAILAVHTFGVPAEMESLLEIARKHGLRVIEDACEALGAEYGGQRVGSLGDLAVFAFYPNKPFTTGEGGVFTTRDAKVAEPSARCGIRAGGRAMAGSTTRCSDTTSDLRDELRPGHRADEAARRILAKRGSWPPGMQKVCAIALRRRVR